MFAVLMRRPPVSPRFPYTTLFRSVGTARGARNYWRRPVSPAAAFDAIVIGAGANGLTASATLGRAGRRVLVTIRSEEHTSELQSLRHLVCRLLLEKKNMHNTAQNP